MDDIKNPTTQDSNPDSGTYSSSYVPKPGDIIRPQHSSAPDVPVAEKSPEVLTSISNANTTPVVPTPAVASIPASPLPLAEKPVEKVIPGTPVPFPNPFADPNDINPEDIKAKASGLQKMGVNVVKSSKFKKIIFSIIGGIIGVVIIMFGVNIAMTYLFPKPPEVITPPIIAPPIVKDDPKEDKSSLKYIDSKVRELKPSLTELNNDSSFMLKLNLEDSDYEKNATL